MTRRAVLLVCASLVSLPACDDAAPAWSADQAVTPDLALPPDAAVAPADLVTPPDGVIPPSCMDGVKNGTETDTDCGGGACPMCVDGRACAMPKDCQSGVCSGHACAVATCSDATKNGGESDVDCGGPCSKCGAGKMCASAEDCGTGVCKSGVCVDAACTDGTKNGSETDVDCGGSCGKCDDGKACGAAGDCTGGICDAGKCATPSCDDKKKNGGETDVDCGGSCGKCGDGKACGKAEDCGSGYCAAGKCATPACDDKAKNGDESDVDCGGSCGKCGDGKACALAGDCSSGVCAGGKCASPTCDDKAKNGGETDVDCGGSCSGKCAVGKACLVGSDCASAYCLSGACAMAAPSCFDIKAGWAAAPDGEYTIDPDGAGAVAPLKVWCDMTTDGGGWTMLAYWANDVSHRDFDFQQTQVMCAYNTACADAPTGYRPSPSDKYGHLGFALFPGTHQLRMRFTSDGGGKWQTKDVTPTALGETGNHQPFVIYGGQSYKARGGSYAYYWLCGTQATPHYYVQVATCGGSGDNNPTFGLTHSPRGDGSADYLRTIYWDGAPYMNQGTQRLQLWLRPARCSDGAKGQTETDIDCGGPACPGCATGKACKGGRDCKTGVCSGGTCAAEQTSCKAIIAAEAGMPDGTYRIDPDGAGIIPAFDAFCHMSVDGGGWTRCATVDYKANSSTKIYGPNGALATTNTSGSSFGTAGTRAIKLACFDMMSSESGLLLRHDDSTVNGPGSFDFAYAFGFSPTNLTSTTTYAFTSANWSCPVQQNISATLLARPDAGTSDIFLFAGDGVNNLSCTYKGGNGGTSSGFWMPIWGATVKNTWLEISDSSFDRLGTLGPGLPTEKHDGVVEFYVR